MLHICISIFCKTPLGESLYRLGKSFYYRKNRFKLSNSSNVFETIYTKNWWNSNESFSGEGSTVSATKTLRKMLPIVWEKYEIKTVLDIPCGDFNWMKEVDKSNIIYTGGDVVKKIIDANNQKYQGKSITFKVLDITKDNLPQVDMIFCKDCLQHLSHDSVRKALINFKKSGSKYLLVTSYPLTWKNWDILDGDYRPLNLRIKPFKLPKPICKINEVSRVKGNEKDKYMFFYELKSIIIK
jgi:hypothetical protein